METLWQRQRRSIACGLLSGVFLVTAVVLSRRISGDAAAFTSELAASLTGMAASLIAMLVASVPELSSVRLPRPARQLLISGCGIPGVMLGLTLLPSGSSTGMACLLGLYLTTVLTLTASDSDTISVLTDSIRKLNSRVLSASDNNSEVSSQLVTETPLHTSAQNVNQSSAELTLNEKLSLLADAERLSDAETTEPDKPVAASEEASTLLLDDHEPMPHPASNPQTTQWMSRSTVDGYDVAEGAFQVQFEAGQKLAPVHLPFSPPLAGTPEFECEPADDSDLKFRTTAVHAYGIRIEVMRSTDCDQAATVEVAWMASAALSESIAA